ncbi:MAG: PEP-CTERM sorting domain-containing protein [Verrucomicrobia bacterium]|nr:PEP-CTERM sorting domain-containing protein [Verrucomicrobiota bacterium]
MFVVVMLVASQAFAWNITQFFTVTPDWGVDGRIYMPDGATLVNPGAVLQILIDVEGNGFTDPAEYFGGDIAAITAWINAGAPALGDDILATGPTFDGNFALTLPGEVFETPMPFIGINVGAAGMQFGWRAFNLSEAEMAEFCTVPGVELWYTTVAEVGLDGAPWTILDASDLWNWDGYVGTQVYFGMKPMNVLDVHLATCGGVIPEPGTMLLIGSSALLLFIRRKK